MTNYEKLTAAVEAFADARGSYWQDLGKVLEPLLPKFREYLGVTSPAWRGLGGREYPYITLGIDDAGNFVPAEINDLEPTGDLHLAFLLKFNLQVGQRHQLEEVFLSMTVERKGGDYLFGIDGLGDIPPTQAVLKEIHYSTGNWDSFFGAVTNRIAQEFAVGRFV